MIFSYLLNMQSHPSWVCGLKQRDSERFREIQVTPFVGVWIETVYRKRQPSRKNVTPFVGVWIETFGQCQKNTLGRVTPFVGVWIETERERDSDSEIQRSHPSWVCGLKLPIGNLLSLLSTSHPSWVCGLKPRR